MSWLKRWLQEKADNSLPAEVIRQMAAKSVLLGMLDAVQNPNAVLAEIAASEGAAQDPSAQPTEKMLPPVTPNSIQPAPLPRPMLLAMPTNEAADEADRPGVPPKKIRKQKKGPTTNGEAQTPPADAPSGNVSE